MLNSLRRFNQKRLANVLRYSTQPVEKQTRKIEEEIQETERISRITPRIVTKKPQKPPFVKNLMLGVFDTDILAYPELEKEDLNNLENSLKSVKSFLNQPEIKECNIISRQFLQKLSRESLLGLQISQMIGGRELNVTEVLRFIETFSELNLKHSISHNESLGIQLINKFGSDQLKGRYLLPLIKGNAISAFCLLEPLPNNTDSLKRTGTVSMDDKTWVLNGERRFVVNGSVADFFIAIAHTGSDVKHEYHHPKFTAFLVERDFGGVTSSRNPTLSGLEVSNLVFENTSVPKENIIGNPGDAEEVVAKVNAEFRLNVGSDCTVLLRNLVDKATEHFIKVSKAPVLLYETEAVQSKIGEIVTSAYAAESILYLTAGLLDTYENQDCELESTIVKVFASEQALKATSTCLEIVGPEASLDGHWCSNLHKEAICHMVQNDANDGLKSIIALQGLKYAGENMGVILKKLRNPLFHSSFILKRLWTSRKQADDNPSLTLNLHHYLHPSLVNASENLEYCVLRLQYASEVMLSRYGSEIILKHSDLRRIADCMVDAYAMTAAVARASRSYCIGLQHADYEMKLAHSFCAGARERVQFKLNKVIDGQYTTNDDNYREISKRLFSSKKYFPVHPLTRNF